MGGTGASGNRMQLERPAREDIGCRYQCLAIPGTSCWQATQSPSQVGTTLFFFVLRRFSRLCWVRFTPSYGPPFLSVVGVPGVNFQETHVGRKSVLPGLPRSTDRRLSFHHDPSTWLHIISIVLYFSLYMCMPPQVCLFSCLRL